MTCVNCSTAIERGLSIAFKDQGLVYDEHKGKYEVNVALLMHKMNISFDQNSIDLFKISADKIISEVEDLGFGAALLQIHEI
jgi:copper chaperone CopZ